MTLRKKLCLLTASLVVVGLVVLIGCSPLGLLLRTWYEDRPQTDVIPAGFSDDASRLNRTRVAEVWDLPATPAEAEAQLAKLLRRARAEKLGVSIAGARHSMGGHTICPDGIVVNMLPFRHLELDADKKLLRAGGGARWSEIVPYLDAQGWSVWVMQSNNDFSVGGSLSVNCHGWQAERPPIASTVESLRLMKADGTVVRCSRTENAELFGLVLGGYGLFGVILEAALRVVPNDRYRPEVEVVPTSRYVARFTETVTDETPMVYGRLCVVPGEPFLKEAILTRFRKAACPPNEIPALSGLGYTALRREIFRAQIGNEKGKALRWKVESRIGESLRVKHFARNQLLNEPAEVYQEKNADRTDILHEYFIPAARFEDFLAKARTVIPRHDVDLMNVTVRNVRTDKDSFLRYADQDMFAFVMLFNQPRTAAAEPAMEACTRELIDAALARGGRFYLPYRLHATREQFRAAYPQAPEFFAKRRQYDPDGLFRNQFSLKYGEP